MFAIISFACMVGQSINSSERHSSQERRKEEQSGIHTRTHSHTAPSLFVCLDSFNGWDNFSQFKYLVATGVLVFVYTFVLIFVYIFRRTIEQRCLYLPPIELALDGIFCVLLLAAGAAAAQKMNADYIGDQSILDLVSSGQKSNLQASVVFTFFNLLCFIASTFFSYRENAAEERKR